MEVNYFTVLCWFCHTSTWIYHRYTEPPSLFPPRTIPLGHPSAPAPSIQYPALNLDWRFVSYMILYMFQCHSPKSSHPLPFPQSPKDCSIHLCTMLLKSLMHHDRSSAVSLLLSLKVTWDYQVHLFLPWDSSLKTSTLVSKIFCFHSPSVIIPNLNMSSQDYIWLMGDKCIQYFARWSKDSL